MLSEPAFFSALPQVMPHEGAAVVAAASAGTACSATGAAPCPEVADGARPPAASPPQAASARQRGATMSVLRTDIRMSHLQGYGYQEAGHRRR